MTAKARVVHNVARLIAHQGRLGGVVKLIEDKTGEKRLSRHITFSSLSGERVFVPLVVEAPCHCNSALRLRHGARGATYSAQRELAILFPFHGREQDTGSNTNPAVEPVGGIHAEVQVQLVAEEIEVLLEVGHARLTNGHVVVLRQPRSEQESSQERQWYAIFEQLTDDLVVRIQHFPFIS